MADITSNLVAHWKLDEPSGTSAADSSGNGYTGTYTNSPTLNQTGAFGASKAVTFASASSQRVTTSADSASLRGYPLTVAAWVKTSSTPSINPIACKYVQSSFNGWMLWLDTGKPTLFYYNSNGIQVSGAASSAITTGAWHHIVMSVDSGGGVIYVDGSSVKTIAWGGSPAVATSTTPIEIGNYISSGSMFAGTIDDVRIYSRALSAADVAALYAYTGFLPFILDDCE